MPIFYRKIAPSGLVQYILIKGLIMATKHEWRKKEKQFYLPKAKPAMVDVPEYNFIMISGAGNPNSQFFSDCIAALYCVAYAIKMNLKKVSSNLEGYYDWTVYPLEGVWDISEKGNSDAAEHLHKDELVFDLMILQPSFVIKSIFDEMLALTKDKKP